MFKKIKRPSLTKRLATPLRITEYKEEIYSTLRLQCTNLISKKVLDDFMNFCQFSSTYFCHIIPLQYFNETLKKCPLKVS